MNTPPPLPTDRSRRSFHHQAAAAGLLAPWLALLTAMVFSITGQDAPSRTALLLRGILCTLFILAGLVCAITALCGIPRHGRRGLMGRGIVGLALNGVFVAAMGFTLISAAGKNLKQRREAWSDFESAARDLRTGMQTNYSSESGLTNDMVGEMENFRSRLQSAAQTARGDDAIIMQASAALAAETQAQMQQLETATEALGRVEPANLSTLTNRNQIEERRTVVTNFMAANRSLKEFITRQDDVVELELRARSLPPAKIEQFLTAFRSSQAPILPRVAAIRNCDEQMGQALLKILDIAEAHWGDWEYDPDTEITSFEDGAAADAYNAQAEAISQAAARQVQLQGEVIRLQQRVAEAREERAR